MSCKTFAINIEWKTQTLSSSTWPQALYYVHDVENIPSVLLKWCWNRLLNRPTSEAPRYSPTTQSTSHLIVNKTSLLFHLNRPCTFQRYAKNTLKKNRDTIKCIKSFDKSFQDISDKSLTPGYVSANENSHFAWALGTKF